MMNRLFESLVKNFGFESVPAGLGAVSRSWSQEVEVVWYGKRTETYKVVVHPWGSDSVRVDFMHDRQLVKQKIYASGPARTLNAIQRTVECAGFKWEVA